MRRSSSLDFSLFVHLFTHYFCHGVSSSIIYLKQVILYFLFALALATAAKAQLLSQPITSEITTSTTSPNEITSSDIYDNPELRCNSIQTQKSRFKWPKLTDMSHLRLSEQQLTWLLGGYDVIGHSTLHYTSMGL